MEPLEMIYFSAPVIDTYMILYKLFREEIKIEEEREV
jgi:hypothetical protein